MGYDLKFDVVAATKEAIKGQKEMIKYWQAEKLLEENADHLEGIDRIIAETQERITVMEKAVEGK